jgi:hypothetical protein
MQVGEKMLPIAICPYDAIVEASTEHLPIELVPPVVALGVVATEFMHRTREMPRGRLKHEVVMVRHQGIAVDADPEALWKGAQNVKKHATVGVVDEDRPAPAAAVHDVVASAWEVESKVAQGLRVRCGRLAEKDKR